MLVRYKPRLEFNTLQRQMNHLFNSALVPSTVGERAFTRVPAADIKLPKMQFLSVASASLKTRLKIKVVL